MANHAGHRQRVFKRLQEGNTLEDHELIEVLLYYCFPRINTNELAHDLCDTFGNIDRMFEAKMDMIKTVYGIGDSAALLISLVGQIAKRIKNFHPGKKVFSDYIHFSAYLRDKFNSAKKEYAELCVVEDNGEVKYCHRFSTNLIDEVSIPAMEVTKFIASFEPHRLILVHNHVFGDSTPSEADINCTKQLYLYLNLCGLKLEDHYIYSQHNIVSFKRDGLMDKIAETCTLESVLDAMEKI